MNYVVLIGRILYALVFLNSGFFGHLLGFSGTSNYAASQGVPLPGVAVIVTGLILVIGALSVLLGYKTKVGALLLVIFLIPVSFIMHNFWALEDPQMAAMQQAHFMKNLSMAGAALLIYHFGPGPMSLDEKSKPAA